MNCDKNLGRKRLGRIAITGSSNPPKRPCQIVHQNDGIKKTSVVSGSHQSFTADLSFSVSFNDCDNDVDLMSALDQMETDFVKKSGPKVDAASSVDRTGRLLRDRSNQNVTPTGQNVSQKVQNIQNMHERVAGNLSTPHRLSGQKNTAGIISVRENLDSFLDLSFTSPMEVNTPQVFKTKPHSTGRKSLSPRSEKAVISNGESKGSLTTSSSSPMVTPRRSTRKKKRGIDCLGNADGETAKIDAANNSDFFKSLMENVSMDELNVTHEDNNKPNENVVEKPKLKSLHVCSDAETSGTTVATKTVKLNDKTGSDLVPSDVKVINNGNDIQPEDLPQIPSRNTSSFSFNGSKRLLEMKPSLEKDQLALASWDLPDTVLKQYGSRGITHMFQWQAECLLLGDVLNGGNLVYSAPTSAGKTMVAELLVLKRVIETRKKAIIILPFVSVTREKMFYLQELYQDAGIRVSGFMGHYAPAGGFSSVDVAVCTIEKGNSLINRMLEENKLDQLGIVVVDEMHLIGDRHRGYLLELLLTKIVYMSKKDKLQALSEPTANIQIVGMSATLPNLDLLAGWLHADLYCTDFRPVPLTECVKIGTALYDSSMQVIRDIDVTYAVKGDEDHVVPLCIETIRDGHSILIFCPTKNWCEKLSETVAREFYNLLKSGTAGVKDQSAGITMASNMLVLPLDQSALKDIVEQLRRTPVGIDSTLGRTVPFGVAYHHAGLTFDERDIVEGAFRQGILKVLIATSTLSSGVNLPARRVLIRTPVFHGQLIDFLTYKQMIGRAGRKGVDTAGESILLCKPNERSKAEKLVRGALPPVHSTLIRNEGEPLSSSLKRAILEVVVSGVATTPDEVTAYASCTLLAASVTKDQNQTANLIQECVAFLQENEFVCKQMISGPDGIETERYVPTQLGAAVLSSSISPDEGLVVFSELLRARQCFVLENELHIIYQVTPIYAQLDSIDWYQYFGIWESLSTGMRKVAELVGVQESFLAKAVRGRILTKTSAQLKLLAIHKRFYTALVLHDLVQETPINVVTKKYNCNKGQLQSLQQSAATFAGMVTVFCARLGWSNLELILSQFQNRLTFGVQRELCDLVRISVLNGQRARVMYNGGYQTVAALAGAHPADIEALLKNSAPFQSNKKQESESEWEAKERKKMRCIFLTGRKGVTEYEAAVAVINEAKSIIQEELGGIGVQWDCGSKVPEPSLKSPVLLSPLAANPKSKRRRLSSNKRKRADNSIESSRSSVSSVVSPPPAELDSKSSSHDIAEASPEPKCSKKNSPVVVPQTETFKDLKMDESASIRLKAPPTDKTGVIKSSITEKPNLEKKIDAVNLSDQEAKVDSNPVCKPAISKNSTLHHKAAKSKQTNLPINLNNLESTDDNMCEEQNDGGKSKDVSSRKTHYEKLGCNNIEFEDNVKTGQFTDSVKTKTEDKARSNCSKIVSPKENLKKIDRVETSKEDEFHIPYVNDVSKPKVEAPKDTDHESDTLTCEVKKDHLKKVKFSTEPDMEINTPNIEKQKIHYKSLDKIMSNKSYAQGDIESAEVCMNAIPRKNDNCILVESNNEETQVDQHECSGVGKEKRKQTFFRKPTVDNDLHHKHVNKKCAVENDEFGESFVIDTQGMETLENMCINDQTGKDANVSKASEYVRSIFSEPLFSDEECLNDVNVDNGNMVINSSQVNSTFLQDIPCDLTKVSVESREEFICNGKDTSSNLLDMNITNESNEDMFSNSADLIAASNYERIGLGDSVVEDIHGHDDSYEDLHIPYQSGQEKCFEHADAVTCLSDHVEIGKHQLGDLSKKQDKTKVKGNGFGHQLTVLGTFSTPKPEIEKKNQEELHKDLAVALEMGMSFSSTFDVPTQNVVVNENRDVGEEIIFSEDNFGDSLSVSMIDKVFEQSVKESKCSSKDNGKDCLTAEINKYDKHESTDKHIDDDAVTASVHDLKHNCDKDLNICSNFKIQDNNLKTVNADKIDKSQYICDNVIFVTPKRGPVGRNVIKKSVNVQTSKETTVPTPEAEQIKVTVNINAAQVSKSPDLDTSNGSDCVPPTPPDESSMCSITAVGGIGSPARRSLPGTSYISSFSPRLHRSISKAKSKKIEKPLSSAKKINFAVKSTEVDKNSDNKVEDRRMPNNVNTRSDIRNKCSAVSESVEKGVSINTGSDSNNDETKKKELAVDNLECNGVKVDDDNENADTLSPSFIDPEDSGLQLTQSSFSIIDVCGDRRLFKTFILEWRTKPRYALSLACERLLPVSQGPGIGANFKSGQTPTKKVFKEGFGIPVDSLGIQIVGVAVSWENRDAYYISFTHEQSQGDPDDSLAPPPSDTNISIAIRIKAVKSVLQQKMCKDEPVVLTMFDVKAHYRGFAEGCGFAPLGQLEDPKIACWMLDPGGKEKNLHRLVTNLLPTEVHMLNGIGGGIGVSSLGMSPQNPGSGRYRACTEAVLVRHLGEYFRACLKKDDTYRAFKDVEMPSAVTLCRMELNGFGFSLEESESQKSIMIAKLSALEEQAYRLAGHPFSLSASEDVAQVLFVELQLPPNGDPNAVPVPKSLAPKRGTTVRKGRGKSSFSTSKDILEKLQKLHPLPGTILEWRRITNALTKTVYPLQKEKVHCDWLSMYRIYGDCQLHTATGRVSMTEPNLQNVPKDFEIVLPDLIGESPPANTMTNQQTRRRSSARLQQMIGPRQVAMVTDKNSGSKVCLSMRNVFIPFKGGVLLAADYSQLELRMISYLSNDEKLMGILNKDGDVFKLITAQWKNISPDSVTTEQRTQAKQVCYGMIYGIGAKTLSEQLEVDENDAAVFIETFKAKYPGMRRYLRQTVELCRSQGYVQTMLGRKRYLQSITSSNPHARAQAERQAINTTVQGSAADLVKMATIRIDEKLREIFPQVRYTHRHKHSVKKSSRSQTPPDGAFLVLQLHDELIYEVSETHLQTVAQIVKHCMESAMKLPVKMPVKIKVGPSWGKLEDYEL